jgi:hypothetical protein
VIPYSLAIWVLALCYAFNSHQRFGSNWLPQSDLEVIANGIFALICCCGVITGILERRFKL